MHIIEVFTKGKHSEATNEDGWIVTNDFAAVIDGSTSKVEFRIGNKSKGQFATETIREAISHLPSNISMSEALLYLTEALASAVPDLLHKEAGYCPKKVCKLQSSYICSELKNQRKNNEAYKRTKIGINF